MAKTKVSIFDEPEKIDSVIKLRLQSFTRKGGNCHPKTASWLPEEIELIDAVIFDYITKQGLSREETARQISSRWNIGMSTARKYIKEAIQRFANSFENDTEELRKIFLERCETILQDALETSNPDTALKAMDLMAKSLGFYKDNKSIELTGDNTIHFEFQ